MFNKQTHVERELSLLLMLATFEVKFEIAHKYLRKIYVCRSILNKHIGAKQEHLDERISKNFLLLRGR